MKNSIYIWSALLMIALTGVSCGKEYVENSTTTTSPQIALTFTDAEHQTGTRGFGDSSTTSWERAIYSATVLLCDAQSNIIFRRELTEFEIANIPDVPIRFTMPNVQTGDMITILAVANRSIPENITTLNQLNEETETDIANYNGTFTDVSSKGLRSGGFTMTGQSVATITEGTTTATVELRRVVAKVEVSITTSESFKSKYGKATMTINKIILSRGTETSYLINHTTGTYPVSSTFSTEQESSLGKNLFYIFEKDETNEGNRVLLTIIATFDEDGSDHTTNDQTPSIYNVELKGAGNGKILRNGAYVVNGLIDGLSESDLVIRESITPWETLPPQDLIL